jgi:hypothetical protein
VKTEFDRLTIPVKGRGGTINLSHKGDASFGDIACNHTYSRKITITNSGSISSDLNIELLVVGHNSSDSSSSYVLLSEVFTGLDPRSGWSRQQLCRERGIIDPSVRFTGRENWKLIALVVRKSLVKEEVVTAPANVGRGSVVRRSSVAGLLQMNNSHARLASNSSNYAISAKKVSTSGASTHFKRRQMLYHLVTTIQLTSQSTPTTKPFIRVKPDSCILPSYGETTLELELNISTETPLLATLAIKADIPNTPIYEIPISASPRAVNIICDDTRILNFYRQPLGESETLTRTFTNVGHKDVTFKFTNTNVGLSITPTKGTLRMGQTVVVNFHFKPVDEALQTSPVYLNPTAHSLYD